MLPALIADLVVAAALYLGVQWLGAELAKKSNAPMDAVVFAVPARATTSYCNCVIAAPRVYLRHAPDTVPRRKRSKRVLMPA